jgi:hypothetical protein
MLQGALAILLLYVHTVGELLTNVAGILVLFSALVAVGLFRVKRHKPNLRAPRAQALIAAAIYAGSSIWMLYNAFRTDTGLLPWLVVAAAAALLGYFLAPKKTS